MRYSYFDANGLLAMTTLADGNHTYYYYDALERLDLKEQTVIRLRFFEDMKLEEIAMVMDENPNTIKSRLYRTLKELQVKMA